MQQLLALADDLAEKGTALGKGTTAKAWAVQHILHSCEKRKEKLVIFSQYLMDLDELEHVLQQVSQAYTVLLVSNRIRFSYWTLFQKHYFRISLCTYLAVSDEISSPPPAPDPLPFLTELPPSLIDNPNVLKGSADKSCPGVQEFQWSKGKQYLRLDGKVSSQIRQQHTRRFNDPTSSVQVLEHFTTCHLVKGG